MAPISTIDLIPEIININSASISRDRPSKQVFIQISECSVFESETRIPSYHQDKKSEYVLPNDSREHVRLETQAMHLSNMMNNNIIHAPIKQSATRCLDIGCGTGIVTDLLSQKFPTTKCIGLDLSKVPELRTHGSNVRFFQGNVADQAPSEWIANDGGPALPQDTDLFDLCFSRLLILGMRDWPAFIRKEFELLRPGGWAEVHDIAWHWLDADDNIASDGWEWLKWLRQDLEGKKGMDTRCGEKIEQWMKEAGFVDIQVKKYWFPLNGTTETTPEMRAFGHWNAVSTPAMLHYAIPRAMTGESEALIDRMRNEMQHSLVPPMDGFHQYFYVTIGRKPA